MKDNRGITLVELLVSLAIFGIVATILASITSMALKFYSSEKVDAGMQYEGQIALNSIMDATMQTNGIAIQNDTISTIGRDGTAVNKYATRALFLGEFFTQSGAFHFKGRVILGNYNSDVAALYVLEYADFTGGATVNDTMARITDDFNAMTADQQRAHLLAERIDYLLVEPSAGSVSSDGVSSNLFYNPFSVDITISMESITPKGVENQVVKDRVMVRNALDTVYYGGVDYAKDSE